MHFYYRQFSQSFLSFINLYFRQSIKGYIIKMFFFLILNIINTFDCTCEKKTQRQKKSNSYIQFIRCDCAASSITRDKQTPIFNANGCAKKKITFNLWIFIYVYIYKHINRKVWWNEMNLQIYDERMIYFCQYTFLIFHVFHLLEPYNIWHRQNFHRTIFIRLPI